jgi:hypothetical protein
MKKGNLPPAQDTPDEDPQPDPAAPMTMVIWVHDGPVCVTVVDLPAPHASSGICRCAACHAHDPDRAMRYF